MPSAMSCAGRGQVLPGQHPHRVRQPGLPQRQEGPQEAPLQDRPRAEVQDQDDHLQHRQVARVGAQHHRRRHPRIQGRVE